MTQPLTLPLVTTRAVLGKASPPWKTHWPLLASAALIGMSGTLVSDLANFIWLKIGLQLAFVASLSMFAAATFCGSLALRKTGIAACDTRSLLRRLSRQIYLLLYMLAAAKVIQFWLRAPIAGRALSETMQGLWPYFAEALIPLTLARLLASRFQNNSP